MGEGQPTCGLGFGTKDLASGAAYGGTSVNRKTAVRIQLCSLLLRWPLLAMLKTISTGTMKVLNGSDDKTPFLIGVSGGTASGKSTVCKRIMEKLGQDNVDHRQRQVVCISQDSFYKELNEEDKAKAFKGLYNFDHPDAFDNELTVRTLHSILSGKPVKIPVYDFKTNSRNHAEEVTIYPADVVLFEGILVFYFCQMRDLFHMKLFVDTDSDTRLSRRVLRDISDRGRDLEQILYQYTTFVKPAFEEFCLPTKKYADVIIPRGEENTVAIDLIVQHIQDLLHPNKNGMTKRLRHNSDSVVTRPH